MKTLKRILSYPLSIVFYTCFGLTLILFHPLQWLGLKVGGKRVHRGVVNSMNLCLLRTLHVLGVTFSFKNQYQLPENRSLIIVSNHQSMFDIPLISWFMRKHKPKFISKIELGKGIPSISFNLRKGENVLIDRNNPRQSVPALIAFGKFIEAAKFSAVIFPEGTRSRTGLPKDFATNGLKLLFRNAPDALIVPMTINNSWKLLKKGNFPLGVGLHITLETQKPLEIDTEDSTLFIDKIKRSVVSSIKQ